jgi:hypothetical protein
VELLDQSYRIGGVYAATPPTLPSDL